MPPVRAVSTIEIAGFAPGTTSTVTDPAFVCTPLAAYARIANVRLGPAGTLIVSTATPFVTGMLKRRAGLMSGALTSTTTSVAGVPAASTRTKSAAAAPFVTPGSRHAAKVTSDASATGTALHRARGMGVPRGLGTPGGAGKFRADQRLATRPHCDPAHGTPGRMLYHSPAGASTVRSVRSPRQTSTSPQPPPSSRGRVARAVGSVADRSEHPYPPRCVVSHPAARLARGRHRSAGAAAPSAHPIHRGHREAAPQVDGCLPAARRSPPAAGLGGPLRCVPELS